MTTTETKNSDGSIVMGENLRQNVLLATAGTIETPETLKSSKIEIALSDTSSDTDKETTPKKRFWKNLFNLRENLVKNKNTACVTSVLNKCDEKSLNSACVIGSATSLSKRNKNQIDDDKTQHHDAHNLDDTGDCISELIGHIGKWQIVWVTFLILFQVPSAFHIFAFMFQVIKDKHEKIKNYECNCECRKHDQNEKKVRKNQSNI